jgi:solute carrier family 6 amino acid transporter-like protein 5/7/9/14
VSLINCGTSVFAGFAVFSLLGFMATQLNREVKDVVEAGE